MSAAATVSIPGPAPRVNVRVVFGGLMLVLLLAALDQTIVATALPTIVSDLGGLNQLAWVTSAFLLAQTAVTPVYGKLGDLYGRKRILQSAIVLFLAGSALCGQANSMTELIAFRAVQGLGAGGLVVLIQAVIGDIVAPRDRGRYQGLFGAAFGIASVGGPLLGGADRAGRLVAVDLLRQPAHRSRRALRAPGHPAGHGAPGQAGHRLRRRVAAGGRTQRDRPRRQFRRHDVGWGSTEVIVVGALGIALIGAFVFAESRAREPVLPLELLRDRLFVVCGTLSFIVGFALFGSVTFLPLYFQTVDGASPTGAGLRLVAMIGGLLVMSILSGQLISRTGRYKVFPVMGTALMAIGLVLLSRLDVGASVLIASAYLLVLGLGLGAVMQVLVLAVQNAVDYSMLGAATSAVTLARGMGGSLGTAVFGSIFTSQLRAHLKNALTGSLGHQVASGGRLTGAQVVKLPPPVRHVYENAYVLSLRPVLLVAGGVAALGFVLSLLIQQRPLREAATASTGLEDSMAAPRSSDSLAEIERSLTKLTTLDERRRFRTEVAARSGRRHQPGGDMGAGPDRRARLRPRTWDRRGQRRQFRADRPGTRRAARPWPASRGGRRRQADQHRHAVHRAAPGRAA